MKCGALILAAGGSKRLETPKQLARLDGETLLERSIRIAREAGCEPVIVVLGAFEKEIRSECDLQNTIVVTNSDWAEGMGTSLARGISSFKDIAGVLIMTCDMPAVTAAHLRALAESGEASASSYAGQRGVPAYFSRELFPELLRIKGNMGARELLRSARTIELLGGDIDIDTSVDLARAQKLFASGEIEQARGPRRV